MSKDQKPRRDFNKSLVSALTEVLQAPKLYSTKVSVQLDHSFGRLELIGWSESAGILSFQIRRISAEMEIQTEFVEMDIPETIELFWKFVNVTSEILPSPKKAGSGERLPRAGMRAG